ncbi:MAG: Recombinase [Candidatus Yanofskybacteria bacterium GW2011_GWD2_39_48]|uniref:Recombinase n=1 Tax=Candidatus Yanofskybacteria bacterium GW2011_GWD2_39_48 TaxID=1619031 RepID=A0A0G0SED6_9BACT|nr:MAG: Recombinase [Candidatus Yanofskybacteria bacterium GW2011_GWD2_39_48]
MLKPKYFLYARKSTEEDDRQVMSIEAQLFELREIARKENLEILEEFQESKSAKTPGREVFGEMMARVEQNDGVGILAWHPDRLARNSIDGGRIIYAVDTRKVVSLRFPTFWFEPTPQGLFMLQVAFGQSKYYSDNLAENIKRGIRQKLRRGEWLNLAPFGYQNNPRTHNIEPHPTEARIVKLAFEEYPKGTHSFISLAQFLADLGVVSRNGTPLAKASIKRLLTNRAYLGFIKHSGEWFDGSFEPIISPQLFSAVEEVLKSKERPRKRKARHDFPFTGLFRCEECQSMISAQWATGKSGHRYRYYRCSKKRGVCSQSYTQEHFLAEQIQSRLKTISLCDVYTDWMLHKVTEFEREEVSVSQSEVQNLSDSIKANEARMEKLVSTYLDGDIAKEMYLTRKDTLMRAILALKEKKKDFERGRNNWVEPLRNWILDLKQADFLSTSNDFHEIKSFVQKIGTNPLVRDKSARPNSSRSDATFCPHPRRRRGTSSTFRIRKFQSAEGVRFELTGPLRDVAFQVRWNEPLSDPSNFGGE